MATITTQQVDDGPSALREIRQRHYDLAVADDRLPAVGMQTFVRDSALHGCGVLVVSSDRSEDNVTLLEDGADDVVARPYFEAELQARIRAILRRRAPAPKLRDAVITAGPFHLHVATRLVTVRGKGLQVPRLDFAVLLALQSRGGVPVPRGVLLEECWSPAAARRPEHVDAVIHRLRARLELEPSQPRHLVTVRNRGFALWT
jgi:DNA-binding response OmpR family regulator